MLFDILLIALAVLFIFIGYKVGFLASFIKIASILSGLILAFLLTKPTANLACSMGLDNGISNNIYKNITSSEEFQSLGSEEGTLRMADLLEELGFPKFVSKFAAKEILNSQDPYVAARGISDAISRACMSVIIFIIILISSSLIFKLIKILVKRLRKSVRFIRILDGVLGVIFYSFLFLFFIYVMLLIVSIIIQSSSTDSGFVQFLRGQLKLDSNKFGITKYFYEHNILGNLLGFFF